MTPDMTGTGCPQGVGERGIAADGDRRQRGDRLFRYCVAVPANRIDSGGNTSAQVKTMQEVILVFSGFPVFWLGEGLTWNQPSASL
jgi:hypothetical protein